MDLQINESERIVVIDLLTNQQEGVELIPIGTGFELPNKRGFFGQRRFNRGTYIAKIKPLDCNIEFRENPLLCSFLQSDYASECLFRVNGECKIPFSIAINKRAFLNFKNRVLSNDEEYELPFSLEIVNERGVRMHNELIVDRLMIRAIAFRSEVKLSYTSDLKQVTFRTITPHDNDTLIKVGMLSVRHNGNVSCAPSISNISLRIETNRSGEDIPLRSFCVKPIAGDEYQSDNGLIIQIPELEYAKCIQIPIYWDMAQINYNPLESTSYDLSIRHNDTSHKLGEIQLMRDTSVTEPDVRIQIGDNTEHIYLAAQQSEDSYLPKPIQIAYVQDAVINYDGNIFFENMACANNHYESIAVWDVSSEVSFAHPCDESRLKLVENKTLNDFIEIEPYSDLIHLKPREKKSLYIRIRDEYIRYIEAARDANVTEVEIILKLSYRLYCDLDGSHYVMFERGDVSNVLCPNKLENTIHVKLKKQPNPEWMCVDFGTSAVVAGLSDSQHRIKYIDLKQTKDRFLAIAYPDDAARHLNNDEDDMFISSSICLNPQYFTQQNANMRDFRYITMDETNVKKSVDDYKLYPVWFSPGVGVIYRDYQMPCLKMIMGYRYIPNIFNANKNEVLNWKYKVHDDITNKDSIETLVKMDMNGAYAFNDLLRIENLFYLIYKQLFSHYLKVEHINNRDISRQINQLVLTVPNTYTPYNIDTICHIAREMMPTIHPEYLKIVSESDAVACYYLLHRETFFRSEVMTEERRTRLKNKENVLVYDMGAGTLDLTLFSIEQDDKKMLVNIRSKMGVNIAGNYLDYTIAEILKNSLEDKKLSKILEDALLLDKSTAITRSVGSETRTVVKKYVKEIKKHLNETEYQLPDLNIKNMVINFDKKSTDIVNDPKFQDFIDTITDRVLTNFFKGKAIQINTVIFSGRSTELNLIREQVKNTLSRILPDSNNMFYANICNNMFYRDIQFGDFSKHDQLKKVVTEGALAYADRYSRGKNYCFKTYANYATFGIITYDDGNHYAWHPLIESGKVWNERGVVSSEEKTISTQGILWLEFVQTYSSDVIDDYSNNQFDMISRLLRIHTPDCIYGETLRVQLNINQRAKSTLTLSLNNTPAIIQPHEDFSDVELRKSLWPVIF